MANVALNKKIEEKMTRPECAVDGEVDRYTANSGFAQFRWPGNITVDLEELVEVSCIRILLWDGLGTGEGQADSRIYKYRLLISEDHMIWDVIYDSADKGYNGWQVFSLKENKKIRYVRLHGTYNSANWGIQVVQIEAHDSKPKELNRAPTFTKEINLESIDKEIGDGLPLSSNVQNIINNLENLIGSYDILNPEPFKNLILQLRKQVQDVGAIESSMASIRREITEPVKKELTKASRLGRYSFLVGIIGGLLAIFSIVNNMYPLVKSKNSQIIESKLDKIDQSCNGFKEKLTAIEESTKKIEANNLYGFNSHNLSIDDIMSLSNIDTTTSTAALLGSSLNISESVIIPNGETHESLQMGVYVNLINIYSDNTACIEINPILGNKERYDKVKSGDKLSFSTIVDEFDFEIYEVNKTDNYISGVIEKKSDSYIEGITEKEINDYLDEIQNNK
jgi:hypothetical protein